MKATFLAAYATRLRRLADQMESACPPEGGQGVLVANSDLWAALDADVRAGLVNDLGVEALAGTLLTRARTVAEHSHGADLTPGLLRSLTLLNRQTALALSEESQDAADAPGTDP